MQKNVLSSFLFSFFYEKDVQEFYLLLIKENKKKTEQKSSPTLIDSNPVLWKLTHTNSIKSKTAFEIFFIFLTININNQINIRYF